MLPLSITRLVLTDFRNYGFLKLETEGKPIVLTGPNGSGKTNLLEAISLFSPGRGLRRARMSEIENTKGKGGWAVSARLSDDGLEANLGTGVQTREGDEGESSRRQVRINGDQNARAGDFGSLLGMSWLTPQMDRLFQEGAGGRRRFIDRLSYGYDPAHAKRTSTYEKIMRERNRLLKESRNDKYWLSSLEQQMAEHAMAIYATRDETIARLNQSMNDAENNVETEAAVFPKAAISIHGEFENIISDKKALEAEDAYRERLENNRPIDAKAGSSLLGPHRSDIEVIHKEKAQPAALCSTGEQKALLISIILADARLQTGLRGKPPVLLLDEITAHLDQKRRVALFDEIIDLKAQAWMTGTDEVLFSELKDRAQFFRVEAGEVSPVDV